MVPAASPRDVRTIRRCLLGLSILAALSVAVLAKAFLQPVLLALFFRFILAGPMRSLTRLRIPPAVAATLVMVIAFGGLVLAVNRLAEPAAQWAEELPVMASKLERSVRHWRQSVSPVTETAERLEDLTQWQDGPSGEVRVVEGDSLLSSFLRGGGAFISTTLLTVVLLYFLLVFGDSLVDDFAEFLKAESHFRGTRRLVREVEHSLGDYLFSIAVINFCLALVMTVGMYLVGMPNPLLWGVMGGVLNFIPYLGLIVGTLVVGIAAVFTYPSLLSALAVPAIFYCISAIEGAFVTPAILGRRFMFNPALIFFWVSLWTWIWGPVGALLAFPLLVTIRLTREVLSSERFRQTVEAEQERTDREEGEAVKSPGATLDSRPESVIITSAIG
ncbi:MAG: AI-2E family transporter [Bdellovibrionales bacterium]|nr:AI-2E family transporter [Bdellovibrionales bacterium]